jgi:hypothetical protein
MLLELHVLYFDVNIDMTIKYHLLQVAWFISAHSRSVLLHFVTILL